MTKYPFHTVDVFTTERFGGNPLAVFPQAAGLGEREMRKIAREFNLSETSFVFPPKDPAHRAHVRIFTPARELPFAGHPNVGTAYVLARLDPVPSETLVFEEAAGLVAINLRRDAAGAVSGATIQAPQPLSLSAEVPVADVAACLGLSPAEIRTDTHRPLMASVGTEFIFVELATRDALRRAAPHLAEFNAAAARNPSVAHRFQLHLYVRDAHDPCRLATRMFAPILGILEDPATGSANATLAALLTHFAVKGAGTMTFAITQGDEMGRPSRLAATATRAPDGSVRATIGGDCVPMTQGEFDLP